MKKEIERLEQQYNVSITLQMEKSDPLDNRSPRCYRIYTIIEGNIICEYGYCKHKEIILDRFENKLKGML